VAGNDCLIARTSRRFCSVLDFFECAFSKSFHSSVDHVAASTAASGRSSPSPVVGSSTPPLPVPALKSICILGVKKNESRMLLVKAPTNWGMNSLAFLPRRRASRSRVFTWRAGCSLCSMSGKSFILIVSFFLSPSTSFDMLTGAERGAARVAALLEGPALLEGAAALLGSALLGSGAARAPSPPSSASMAVGGSGAVVGGSGAALLGSGAALPGSGAARAPSPPSSASMAVWWSPVVLGVAAVVRGSGAVLPGAAASSSGVLMQRPALSMSLSSPGQAEDIFVRAAGVLADSALSAGSGRGARE